MQLARVAASLGAVFILGTSTAGQPRNPDGSSTRSWNLGGIGLGCARKFTISPNPIFGTENKPVTIGFTVDQLGGPEITDKDNFVPQTLPNFNIHSTGAIDWGDATPVTVFDTGAKPGAPHNRLTSQRQSKSHTYTQAGKYVVSAWMQGDFKQNTNKSGSWRCRIEQTAAVVIK